MSGESDFTRVTGMAVTAASLLILRLTSICFGATFGGGLLLNPNPRPGNVDS